LGESKQQPLRRSTLVGVCRDDCRTLPSGAMISLSDSGQEEE